MKELKIGKTNLRICEHQGDINYLRFVRFKQWCPQFFERMDLVVLDNHMSKFMELHNQGKYAQSVMVWYDLKLATKQSKELAYDAWGICFALIAIEKDEDEKSCPDDSVLREKIIRLSNAGLTAEVVKKEVLNFMKASPVEFSELIVPYIIPFMQKETESL